jgi:outer membrane biosynthesis protein TonB
VSAQSARTDSIGESEEAKMQIAEIRASFPGGQRELMSWLAQNMHYPKEMKEIQGRVLVSFYVEKDGSISDVNVERPCIKEDGTSSTVIVEQSEMSALDKEMVRVVKSMPKWEPAMLHGKPVREKHFIPFNIDPQ